MRFEAVLVPVMSLLLLLTVGAELVARLGLFGVVLSEVLLVALPAWLWLGFRQVSRASLGLPPPRVLAVAGGVLAGLGGFWLMAALEAGLLEQLLPTPPEVKAGWKRLLVPDAGLRPLAADLLALAIAPAACEELLFRGGVMRAFSGAGRARDHALAIVTAALLFGVIHASPYRFIPAVLMGVLIGLVRLTSGSLWPAVALHVTNNVAVIVLLRLGYDTPPGGTPLLVAAGVTLAAGIGLTKWRSQRA